jgi:MFS-type transporter involved in bile tolerance (Atg22 family)
MLATAVLNPSLGAWADQTDRCKVVTLGVLAQVGHGMRVGTDGKTGKT